MTLLRQTAMKELEKFPEEIIGFILQIMREVNGLYKDKQTGKKEAFMRLEQLRKKGTVTDYNASEITAILPKDFLERNHKQEWT